jgi:TetR/AcrR family transcriptional repressor of mexJK operon
MPPETKPNPASRLSPERYAHLLAVAGDVFLARGLGNTTIEQIAQQAGISKATIYRRFRNKEELFEEVILQATADIAEAFDNIALDPTAPEQTLQAAADAIYQSTRQPRHLEVFRALIAEAGRQPDLVRRARLRMLDTLTRKLTAYFERLIANGAMTAVHPQQTAVNFTLLAGGGLRPLLNAANNADEEQQRRAADMDLFLRGCGIRRR